jgi:hypothetical protein
MRWTSPVAVFTPGPIGPVVPMKVAIRADTNRTMGKAESMRIRLRTMRWYSALTPPAVEDLSQTTF